MALSYIEIFRKPGSFAFSIFGLIARFPVAMDSLAIVTMISAKYNHYGIASAVAMLYVLSCAALGPQISKLADRYGQGRVAVPAIFATVCAMVALTVSVHYSAPAWLLYVCAAFMGLLPNFGAFVRTRWSRLFRGSPLLHTAFAYESTIDEGVFMLGPIIVIFLATALFPEAALLGAAAFLAVGGVLFCLQKQTEPAPYPANRNAAKTRPLVLMPSIAVVVLTLTAAGTIFGTAEVGAVAIGKAQGDLSHAMWPLSAYAFGSFITGLIYGAMKLKTPLVKQFLYTIGLTALTTLPLLVAHNIPSLTVALLIAGAACSPTIIISMKLMEHLAPPEKLTEGMTWAMAAMTIGFACGLTVAGHMVDRFGPEAGFYFAVISAFFAFAVIALSHNKIKEVSAAVSAQPGATVKMETAAAAGETAAEKAETETDIAESAKAEAEKG